MATELLTRNFGILLSRRGEVDAALTALVKRAARKRIVGVLSWTWGAPYAEQVRVVNEETGRSHNITVERIALELTGQTPRVAGWRFIATLQHLDGENIVRVLPSEELPAMYRTRGCVCDHCKVNRRRNDTYVLQNDDGSTQQVGSSCIRDFLGADDAAIIAAKAELLALAGSVAEDSENEGSSGSVASERMISNYLPIVAWAVRCIGWTSRTAAREDENDKLATADVAWMCLTDAKFAAKWECAPNGADVETAKAAEVWSEEITDAETEKSDYLHNLRAVARTGLVSNRTAGIAASTIVAWQRAIGAERARKERNANRRNEYVGTVGTKVSFGLAPKLGKKGQPAKGAPVVLSAAPVVLDFVTGYSTDYGYTTVLKFRTENGETIVWKASSEVAIARGDVGKRYTLKGTVKAHSEYKGDKQTILTRCDVVEIEKTCPDCDSNLTVSGACSIPCGT